MSIATFMFYFFALLAASSAISIIFIRNVFYGALLLIVCLLAIAGIYVLAFAEFVAVAQILVYVGGILVLIIFGIMLTSKIAGKPLVVTHRNWFAGLLVGVFFLSLFINLFSNEVFALNDQALQETENTFHKIGILLMSDFILPFEIAGILLLVTLVGSAVTASYTKPKE